jgi:NAD(P)-dependent dehydrogenase (short-subunit alcohol dehydrogenase family)
MRRAGTIREKSVGNLEGEVALVTGGNSGIGLAAAREFVNEGGYVFITGRRDPELAAAVKEIGRNVTGVQGDASNLAISIVSSHTSGARGGKRARLEAHVRRHFRSPGPVQPMRSPRP